MEIGKFTRWIGIFLAICLAATLADGSDATAQDRRSDVEIDCGRKTPPAYDCTCVGEEYERQVEQDPDLHWTLSRNASYIPACYDADKIRQYFSVTDCATWNRKADRIRRRAEKGTISSNLELFATTVDCACFASHITESLLALEVLLVRDISAARVEAVRACPAN